MVSYQRNTTVFLFGGFIVVGPDDRSSITYRSLILKLGFVFFLLSQIVTTVHPVLAQTPPPIISTYTIPVQNIFGGPICGVDPNGVAWAIGYDVGLLYTSGSTLQSLTLPGGSTVACTYDPSNNMIYVLFRLISTTNYYQIRAVNPIDRSSQTIITTNISNTIFDTGNMIKIPGKNVFVIKHKTYSNSKYYHLFVINGESSGYITSGFYALIQSYDTSVEELYLHGDDVYFAHSYTIYRFNLKNGALTAVKTAATPITSFYYNPLSDTLYTTTSLPGGVTTSTATDLYYSQPLNALFVAGTFTSLNGQSAYRYLARFDFSNNRWRMVLPYNTNLILDSGFPRSVIATPDGSVFLRTRSNTYAKVRPLFDVTQSPSAGWSTSVLLDITHYGNVPSYNLRYTIDGNQTVTAQNPATVQISKNGDYIFEVYSLNTPVDIYRITIQNIDSSPPNPPLISSNETCETTDTRLVTWQPPDEIRAPISYYQILFNGRIFTATENSFELDNVDWGISSVAVRSVNENGVSPWSTVDICRSVVKFNFDGNNDQSVTAEIGNNQQISLFIPAQATDFKPARFLIYPSSHSNSPSDKTVVVAPHHLEAYNAADNTKISSFMSPVLVTFGYNNDSINPRQLSIYYNDPSEGWVKIPSSVNYTEKTISAYLNHFSEYAVFADGLTSASSDSDAHLSVLGLLPLSLTTHPIDFGQHPITGMLQVVDGLPSEWAVSDPTGTGEGWHVSITASDFVSTDQKVIPSQNLLIKIEQSDIQTIFGNQPPVSLAPDWIVSSLPGQKILSAASGSGMGTYRFTPRFRLIVPANAYAGVYSATLTINLIASP